MPTFGNTNPQVSPADMGGYRIRGAPYTFSGGAGQQADSITALLRKVSGSGNMTWKCMLYKHSDSSLVGTTESVSCAMTTTPTWYTFNFLVKPALTDSTDYVIVIWIDDANPDTHWLMVEGAAGTAIDHYTDAYTFDGAPDPIVFNTYTLNDPSIYCTYSPAGGGAVAIKHRFHPITRHRNRTGRSKAWQYC